MKALKQRVPPTSFVVFTMLSLAAFCVGQGRKAPVEQQNSGRRVLASGRLLGNRDLQQISVSRINGVLSLVIETVAPPSRILWQTDSRNSETAIDSVRIADLDKDGIPEVLSLWRKGPEEAVLRIFHWDIQRRAFVEIQSADALGNVRSYRIVNKGGRYSSRVVVDSSVGPDSKLTGREYELRGAMLVSTAGGSDVKPTGDSGIEGQALISPAHPGPIRQGEQGSAPYKTTIVVWDTTGGREVTRVETGSDGRFRIALRPGIYRVGSPQQQGRFLPRASEETVTVTSGKFTQVTLNFDSGMR